MSGALSKPGCRTAHWRGRQKLCRTKYRNRNKCARTTQNSPRHFLRSATSSRGSPKSGERGRSGRLSAGELLGSRHLQLEGTHAIRAARQYRPRRFSSRLRRDDLHAGQQRISRQSTRSAKNWPMSWSGKRSMPASISSIPRTDTPAANWKRCLAPRSSNAAIRW